MTRTVAVLALASSACSASAADAAGGDAAADAAPPPCSEPPDARPEGATCVIEATGSVEDLSGAPLDKLVMTFCSPNECYGSQSDEAGVYTIPVGTFVATDEYSIHADGRPDHAVDYLPLAVGEPSVISVTMRLPTLPPSTVLLPPDGAPASSVTVGDVTLLVADSTKFDLDIEDFSNGTQGRTLRVAPVPLASAPRWAAGENLAALYALAPSGATPSVPVGVVLKNSAALPASAAVDLLVLGDNYYSTPLDVGVLSVQATAHVSADGQSIQTDPGQGIGELTWLALRKAD